MPDNSIQMNLFDYFADAESFTTAEAYDAVLNHYNQDVKTPSIRARIYEGIDKGLFQRVAKGVYTVSKKDANGVESTCMLINGNGRDLSMIEDNSIDAIITDHPYKLDKALKGGNRNFASYDLFRYDKSDFDEKLRVLKPGAFLLEFLPEESEVNFEYLYEVKKMAIESGFKYFAKVPWKKGDFVANTGRTSKNREDIVFFSKGEPRALRLDAKKNKATALENGLDIKGLDSYGLRDLLEENDLEVSFMKGAAGMLPTEFDFQPRNKADKVMEAEKPVELFDAILPYITLPGEKVLDQFAGSGNLGVSAVKSGRDAILIEQSAEMFEKMKANVEAGLGVDAVKEWTSETPATFEYPAKLYHATYNAYLADIAARGLNADTTYCWDGWTDGSVYLTDDPETAILACEAAYNVPSQIYDSGISCFEINSTNLNSQALFEDGDFNETRTDAVSCFAYSENIPFEHLRAIELPDLDYMEKDTAGFGCIPPTEIGLIAAAQEAFTEISRSVQPEDRAVDFTI